MRRNFWNCPREIKEITYKSIVRPKLEYASAAWDPYLKKDIAKVEKVQRKAARFCTGNYKQTASVTDMIWKRFGLGYSGVKENNVSIKYDV